MHKPYGMISQFSPEGDYLTIADTGFPFPKDAYPVGRLDTDSEGLLLITNDKSVNHRLLDPGFRHRRTYLAQVDGTFTNEAKHKLEQGPVINVNGKPYKAHSCHVTLISSPEESGEVGPRHPPIRFRKSIPTSWIQIELSEGKNRQVRKMTAASGFPTLRLVRTAIEKLTLGKLLPGEVKEYERQQFYSLLNL